MCGRGRRVGDPLGIWKRSPRVGKSLIFWGGLATCKPLLEQHLEVDAGHFVGVRAAGLGLAGEGLHDAEFQVLGDDVVGTDAPAALVVHVAGEAPREGVAAHEGAGDIFGKIVFTRTVVGLMKAVVVETGFGTGGLAAAEEGVDFTVARLQAIRTEVIRMGGVGNRLHRIDAGFLAVLEFAVARGDGQVIVVIAQFGAVEGIEVLQAVGVAADAVDVIAADAEFPVLAAEVVVHFGQIDIGIIAFVRSGCQGTDYLFLHESKTFFLLILFAYAEKCIKLYIASSILRCVMTVCQMRRKFTFSL